MSTEFIDPYHPTRKTFGKDRDVEMDKVERRRESWRRSSRKYRAIQARKRAQRTLFDPLDEESVDDVHHRL